MKNQTSIFQFLFSGRGLQMFWISLWGSDQRSFDGRHIIFGKSETETTKIQVFPILTPSHFWKSSLFAKRITTTGICYSMICALIRTFFRLIGSGRFRSKSLSEIDQIVVMKRIATAYQGPKVRSLFVWKMDYKRSISPSPLSSSAFHSRRRCAMCTTIPNFVPKQYLL